MQFAPKTEEEIKVEQAKFGPFPSGEYDVEVAEASDGKSKAGNDQIHLICKIKDDDGHIRTVHDYLLEAMSAKLRSFCVCAGLTEEYESGQLTAKDCAGQSMRAKVRLEKGKDGYEDKNAITQYLPRQTGQRQQSKPQAAPQRTSPPPTASSGNGALTARESARKTFLSRWSLFLNEFPDKANDQSKYWSEAFKAFFPGKQPDALAAVDWTRFSTALKEWDPIKGFPVPAGSPISDGEEFKDEDIPF